MYKPPHPLAARHKFEKRLYAQPDAYFIVFDLSTGGTGIAYLTPPGLIVDVGMPWLPNVVGKELSLASAYGEAPEKNITANMNANQAGTVLDHSIAGGFNEAPDKDIDTRVSWDASIGPRDSTVHALHKQAIPKDIEGRNSPWEDASVILDTKINASFHNKATPWKDRTINTPFYSSDLLGPLYRREENLPGPLAKQKLGFADLGFMRARQIGKNERLEFVPKRYNNPAQPKDLVYRAPFGNGQHRDILKHIPWGPGGFRDTTLRFVYPDYNGPISPPTSFRIPTLRFYIVANSAQIVRVSDGRDIPAVSVSMSIGSDSYSWSMQANLAGKDALALVEGTDAEPVEVDVMINGATWRILIDSWRLSEAWRTGGGVVQGRSRVAYLAAPYANSRDYVEASGLTAQQLADQELPPGFTLNWNMVDWYVPAGAWQYQGLTPIDAIARIAAAGGGYVQAHPSSDQIIVNPLYPIAPWQFNTIASDFEIPRDVVIQRSSNKKPGQGVNGVYVYGGNIGGIAAHVVRQGTAGEVLASTIVDALNVDTIPARERGIAALAASGRQSVEAHELPLSASLGGLIPVGSLIDMGSEAAGIFVPDWRGIVRGVTVAAGSTRSGNGGTTLSVRQRLDVERHFDEGT